MWKLPHCSYLWVIGVTLWRRDSYYMNISWHTWFGPILSTCEIWDTHYNSDNSETEFMTISVTWQLRVTLDSIRNSCDVFKWQPKARPKKSVKNNISSIDVWISSTLFLNSWGKIQEFVYPIPQPLSVSFIGAHLFPYV